MAESFDPLVDSDPVRKLVGSSLPGQEDSQPQHCERSEAEAEDVAESAGGLAGRQAEETVARGASQAQHEAQARADELDRQVQQKEQELREQASLRVSQAAIERQLRADLETERSRSARLIEENAALQEHSAGAAQAQQSSLIALQKEVENLTAARMSLEGKLGRASQAQHEAQARAAELDRHVQQKENELGEQASLESQPQPQLATASPQSGQERLDDFCRRYALSEYCQAFMAAGYVFVDDLREADGEEYAEGRPLALILGMLKRPERKRLVRLGMIKS
jgi:hypothetical protein